MGGFRTAVRVGSGDTAPLAVTAGDPDAEAPGLGVVPDADAEALGDEAADEDDEGDAPAAGERDADVLGDASVPPVRTALGSAAAATPGAAPGVPGAEENAPPARSAATAPATTTAAPEATYTALRAPLLPDRLARPRCAGPGDARQPHRRLGERTAVRRGHRLRPVGLVLADRHVRPHPQGAELLAVRPAPARLPALARSSALRTGLLSVLPRLSLPLPAFLPASLCVHRSPLPAP
ncbi:hypothetical protein [Streptomyces sp. NPDC088925]|uniref:hypothetical protein n=1 Tax=Streptomyces sp. NPDC088925 TaxID=3365914 RepID=UPI00381884C6